MSARCRHVFGGPAVAHGHLVLDEAVRGGPRDGGDPGVVGVGGDPQQDQGQQRDRVGGARSGPPGRVADRVPGEQLLRQRGKRPAEGETALHQPGGDAVEAARPRPVVGAQDQRRGAPGAGEMVLARVGSAQGQLQGLARVEGYRRRHRLLRAGKGSRQPFGAHRLEWRWVLGPDAENGDQEQAGIDAA